MEINDIFDAQGRSTWQVLCDSTVGYYIPSYQREYSWGKDNLQRLFEDTTHGIKLLVKSNDSITFIGTIISIHDTKYQTVEPIVKQHVPSKVMLIIDGQQRLVTILLIFTIFHDLIRIEKEKFAKESEEKYEWIYAKSREICNQLKATYQFDMAWGDQDGDKNYRFYPRIIRSLDDSWSRTPKSAKYQSPIAHYLFEYHNYSNMDPKGPFYLEIPNGTQSFKAKHEIIEDNCKEIRKFVNQIATGKNTIFEMPSLKEIVDSTTFQETIFKDTFSEEVKEVLLDSSGDLKNNSYQSLFRKIVLVKFIMDRMALTVVTAKNEDYAFDMFEALNTTGEPLTAFETFKPKVIQAEGLSDFENSSSRRHLTIIESYLEIYKKAQDKQKATSNLLIPFALAESGRTLSKRLSDQRRFLKEEYDGLQNLSEKRLFVNHLANISIFIKNSWPDNIGDRPIIKKSESTSIDSSELDLELMCLDFLRSANHRITIALLARFYSIYCDSSDGNASEALAEMKSAIRAVTAFSVLWRSSRRGTDRIDTYYRSIMEDGLSDIGVPAFSRKPKGGGSIKPNSKNIKKALSNMLFDTKKGNIADKTDWIKKAWKQPVYIINVPISRFLLLTSTHDTCPDEKEPGLVKKSKANYLNMLNLNQWRREDELTIEHVAPQNDINEEWDSRIFDDQDMIHCLGNLTLLPRVENSLISNKSWVEKRTLYQVLSASSQEEQNKFFKEAKAKGIDIKENTEKMLEDGKFLPHVKAIGTLNDDWTVDTIEKRSKRLCEIIWDRLIPWLS